MRQFALYFVVTAAAVSVTGCGQMGLGTPSARGGIAVLDLDKVAADTGRDRQLAQSLELAQNSLNQSLAKTVESAKEQLNAKKKGYGEELSDDEKKEFSAMESFAVNKLSQFQNQARAQYEQIKQKQIAQFRAELKPIAQEVAAKKGLSVVVPKNEGLLLSVDAGVDITDEVVKLLRERRPVATPQVTESVPAPAAEKQTTTKKSSSTSKTAASESEDEARR